MDSALFKDLKNGSYLCNICTIQVKAKIWTAHSNGRKHRENIQRLKETLLEKSSQKRKLPEAESECSPKRSRDVTSENVVPMDAMELSSNVKTPWQAEVDNASSSIDSSKANVSTNIIEGLPEGFFDNHEMNSRVRETMEKQKHLDAEMDRFFKEIADEEVRKEEEDNNEAEVSAIHNDIEQIGEQMERWRSINELEKKKEMVVETVTRSVTENPNYNRIVTGGNLGSDDEENDDDDCDEFDFDLDWRRKLF